MAVPIRYRKSAEVLANVPYSDIAAGLGIVSYYGATAERSGSTSYSIIINPLYSSGIESSHSGGSGNTQITFNSSVFNLPRTVKGIAYFNCGFERNNVGDNGFLSVQFQKVSASATSDISSENVSQSYGVSTTGAIAMPISLTETSFAVG